MKGRMEKMNESRNMLRQMEPEKVVIGENTFYIYPFPAFTAANMSGEIMALLMPMVAALAPALGSKGNVLDTDVNEALPHLAGAFSSLSGDRVENLLRKLLQQNNVGVQAGGAGTAQWLNDDLSNEVFCMNAQDMFILAYHVIKVNYRGFFEKFGNLSGSVKEKMAQMTAFPGMAPLT